MRTSKRYRLFGDCVKGWASDGRISDAAKEAFFKG
jgi:hypothetical protein